MKAYFKVDATFCGGGLCMDCVSPLHIAVQLAKWRSEQQSEFKNIGSGRSLGELHFLHSFHSKIPTGSFGSAAKGALQLVRKPQKDLFFRETTRHVDIQVRLTDFCQVCLPNLC